MRLHWDPNAGLQGGDGWPVTEISMIYTGGLALVVLSTLAMHYKRVGRTSNVMWRLCTSWICRGRASRHPVCVIIKDKPRRAPASEHVAINMSQLLQQQRQKHPQISVPEDNNDEDSWTIKSSPAPHGSGAGCTHSSGAFAAADDHSPCTPPRKLELPSTPGGLLRSWNQWQPSWPATPCLSLPSATPQPDACTTPSIASSPQPSARKGQDRIFSELLDNLVVNFVDREPSECGASDLDSNMPTPQSHYPFFLSRGSSMFAAGACAAPTPGHQDACPDDDSWAESTPPPILNLLWKPVVPQPTPQPMPPQHAFQSASITVQPPADHDNNLELPISTRTAIVANQAAVPAAATGFEEPETPTTPRTLDTASKVPAAVSCFLQHHQQACPDTKSPVKAVALRSGLPPIRIDQPLLVSPWEWTHVQQQRQQRV